MGQKKYPTLSPSEVEAILKRSGFTFKRQLGDHAHYERLPDATDPKRRLVTVDKGYANFDDKILKSMISQSGMTRDRFYGATKRTAGRAGVPLLRQAAETEAD